MSTNEKIQYWEMFCKIIFDKFNGWINPVFPASKITFEYYPSTKGKIFMGNSLFDEVNINLISVFEYCSALGFDTVPQVQGVLIYSILHELSHCNQELDYMNSAKLISQEIANDQNVASFVYKNQKDVMNALGGFGLNQSFFTILIKRINGHPLVPYHMVKSRFDKYINFISPFIDVKYRTYLNSIDDIIMWFSYQTATSQIIIKQHGQWVNVESNIEVLKQYLHGTNLGLDSISQLEQNVLKIHTRRFDIP